MIISINGRITKPTISIKDPAFLTGCSVYEMMKEADERHIKKLVQSAENIGIKTDPKKIKSCIVKTQKKSKKPLEMKVIITQKQIIIVAKPHRALSKKMYKKGWSLYSTTLIKPHPEIRSLSELQTIRAQTYAKQNKCDDALFIKDGLVTEASHAAIFFVRSNVLYTPKDDMYESISRDKIIDAAQNIMRVKVTNVFQKHIYDADECFLVDDIKGVIPVTKIDCKTIRTAKAGSIANRLKQSL